MALSARNQFKGKVVYSFVRPVRHHETYNRDHPIIRGVINGRSLLLAMSNPYLDPGDPPSPSCCAYSAPSSISSPSPTR